MTEPTVPTATVIIEPKDDKDKIPREYLIRLTLRGAGAMGLAREALAAFAPPADQADRRRFDEVLAKPSQSQSRSSDAPPRPPAVVGIEATVVWSGRPDDELVAQLKSALTGRCQSASVRELRECVEVDCTSDATVEWNRPREIPTGWYNHLICGKHSYKECAHCKSLYSMTSTNAGGQAPSLSCEVCGGVMVEWGSTKIWIAELIIRRDAT